MITHIANLQLPKLDKELFTVGVRHVITHNILSNSGMEYFDLSPERLSEIGQKMSLGEMRKFIGSLPLEYLPDNELLEISENAKNMQT